MKISVIGANGRSGKLVVEYALQKGWQVTAYLRDKNKLPITHPNLTFVEGNATDDVQIAKAIEGCDAVVSALGVVDVAGDVSLMSEGMKRIIPAMAQHGIKRVLAIGGMGVLQASESKILKDLPDYPAMYKNVAEGHFKVYELLKTTNLDWTFLCCPYIPDGERTGIYFVKKDYMPLGKQQINTGDIADFIINELEQNHFVATRVGISN
jgi:putative NADH-flavin reductase